MEPGRWGRITDIYHATIARPSEERASFLGEECHGDESLRKQVEAMVKSHERSGNFIESPAFAVAPELLIDEPTGDLIGQSIGHYRIESLLGVGGMGEVYLARDERLGRKVALKLLPEHLTEDETQLSRFKTEARTASALNHPNILTVHEIGAEGKRHFIATEFIEGTTLRVLLARGRMNLHDALEIAVQVASALAAAHETGVVHRDIKPENIMLRPDGYAKVLDFGIAKLAEQQPASDLHKVVTTTLRQTRPGLVIGTAQYMSPEQTRGQAADARSDIWSLGVVLYEMVGGVPPFSGATPSDCIASILKTEPPPLSGVLSGVPVKLQSIVHKALRKNRDQRYQTIKAMLPDLRGLKAELDREGSLPLIKGRAEAIISKIKHHKRGALVTLSAAIVAAAAFAYVSYFVAPMPPINGKSIAVLPFVDLSQARDQEYLCDGIQEEILNRLSKIADLKVISRTSTQRYKSAREKLPAMARQLGAAHILEGTVQRAEDQVRIHVQLIDARNDSHLWAEKYDRKLTDVFGVESEIAKAIADSLGAKLSGLEQRAIATRPTENAAAHQLYLQGTYFSNKRTGADLRTATEYFQAAIGKDPKYAAAYAGLADAFTLLSLWGGDPADTMPQAKAAARKAIELDETLPEAHNSLGLVLALHDFDFAQSKKEFERAIELNPNYATAHHQFGNVDLSMIGEFDRAIAEGKSAVELDPLSLIINTDLGQDFMLARRYDEAIEQLRKTLAMDPRFYYARWTLGECLQMKGQLTEAMAEYQKAAEITDDPVVMALLAQGYAKMGQRDKALDLLGQLEQLAKHRHVGPFTFALVHLALDETEKTIDDLERAHRERDPNIVGIKVEPLLDPLRGHPRFERLLAKVVGNAENKSPTQLIESKSIAVLPFEDLSENKEHTFFADGVQDDVLTKLAKVADLKVISRTSVMQYRSKQNLREIGRVLGVSHVLEGTVRRSEGKVHINVQLVDARTDTHVWAEEYDRNLKEVFAIEIEVAQSIANQLRARVSTREQTAMQERSTEDLVAYDLYTRGKNLVLTASGRSTGRTDLLLAVDQLNQAVAHDPSFLQAYCQLASAHDHLYSLGFDRTSARLELANAAIQAASRLRPDAGEAHLARAENLYRGYLDYIGALAELEVARQSLPNDARVLQLMGFILRRQGRWEEATQKLQRTVELDPRNTYTLQQMAWQYLFVRRYAEVKPLLARVLAIEPNRTDTEVFLASVDFHWKADIGPFHQMVDSIRATNPSALPSIADAWITCALAERDPGAAANAMAAVGDDAFGDDAVQFSRTFVEGLVARMMKDEGKARSAFTAARSQQEKIVRAQPNYGPPLCVLGLIDAALGRKEEALREGRRAIELLPVEKDAIRGVSMIKYSAMIAAWAGDKDLACEQLASALRYPSSPSYGDLKLLPWWDPLRGDPRFEKLVNQILPPDVIPTGTTSILDKSIAVLPFENRSEDKSNAYFADGVQDEILTRLCKIGDLKVISRTSTQRYRNTSLSLAEIAKQLGVANLLEGSVQKTNDQVRINVQLIRAADDSHLWADTFDRRLTDIFAVESEVATAIADKLQAALTGNEQRALTSKPTQNLKAYDAYLLGRFELNKFTEAGFKKSVPHFEKAIVLDPEFALAHAGLAETHNMIGYWGYLPPEEAFPEAKRAALQALKLDPTLAEAHAALAVVQLEYEWLFREADHHFREATRFNPNFAIAHVWFAEFLFEMGQFQDGEVELERARELDPLSVRISFDLAVKFYWKREFDRALEQLQKTISMDPDNGLAFDFLSTVFHKKNMPDQAFTASQKAKTLAGEFSREEMADMQKAYEAAGLSGYFRKENELRQKRLAEGKYQSPLNIAMNYAIAGDDSQALDWLEGAVQEHTPWLPELKVEPNWDGLRSQPRFIAVLKKIGLEK